MTRVHYREPITNSSGDLITDATVRLLEPGTTTLISTPIYTVASGGTPAPNPWPATNGYIDFFIDHPRVMKFGKTRLGGTETYDNEIHVGPILPWLRNVKDWGATGDGVTDDAAAIQAAVNAMPAGASLHFPEGKYMIGSTVIIPPSAKGCIFKGSGIPTNAWIGGSTLIAKNSGMVSIIAPNEWYNSVAGGGVNKDPAVVYHDLSFWGAGFDENGASHDTTRETTSKVDYCLVVHGSNIKVYDCLFMSANLDGLLVAGDTGRNGTQLISETHEFWGDRLGIRYTGRDGFHALSGAQDGYIGHSKVQYAGNHGFHNDNGASAWSYDHNHPSRCGGNMVHVDAAWGCNVDHTYMDAVGDFLDAVATPYRTGTARRYGIFIGGGNDNPCHVDHNYGQTESSGGQTQPVVMLRMSGWVIATYNTLRFQTTDTSVGRCEIVAIGTPPTTDGITDIGNVIHKPGGTYDSTSLA